MRTLLTIAGLCVSAAAAWLPPAHAGSFAISPLRLDLAQRTTTTAVTVRNEEPTPVVIQADALLWSQANGEDALEPTRDLLVSPAIFELPANGTQVLRVALRRPTDATRELSYRLVLQEVPPEASPEFTGLRVALRLSLPIFVAPLEPAQAELQWSATRDAQGHLVVRAENPGTAHARVLRFELTPAGRVAASLHQSVPAYVLPGQFRAWTLEQNNNDGDGSTARADRYRLKGKTDRGDVDAELVTRR